MNTPRPELCVLPMRRAALRAFIAACIVAMVVPACGRFRKKPAAAETPVGSPVVRGADSGLELWWWVVTDQRPRPVTGGNADSDPSKPPRAPITIMEGGIPIEDALRPYLSRPVPMPDAVRDKWRQNGLRIVSVPITGLESLQGSLRLSGPVQRQWLGEVSSWTDVVRGPEFPGSRTIAINGGFEELRPGRLRLMSRCWMFPVASGAGTPVAALRLELVPQFEPAKSDRARLQIAASGRPALEDRERTFEELAAALIIDARRNKDDAIVIVPDAPGKDWSAPVAATDSDSGPSPDMPPTLGETMLSFPSSKDSPRARAVIILIPRLPERFELLGR